MPSFFGPQGLVGFLPPICVAEKPFNGKFWVKPFQQFKFGARHVVKYLLCTISELYVQFVFFIVVRGFAYCLGKMEHAAGLRHVEILREGQSYKTVDLSFDNNGLAYARLGNFCGIGRGYGSALLDLVFEISKRGKEPDCFISGFLLPTSHSEPSA